MRNWKLWNMSPDCTHGLNKDTVIQCFVFWPAEKRSTTSHVPHRQITGRDLCYSTLMSKLQQSVPPGLLCGWEQVPASNQTTYTSSKNQMQIVLRRVNKMRGMENLQVHMSILIKELFLIVLLNMVRNYSLIDVSIGQYRLMMSQSFIGSCVQFQTTANRLQHRSRTCLEIQSNWQESDSHINSTHDILLCLLCVLRLHSMSQTNIST